jgi:glucosamine 6-phosphate synthetase-like amidotransferase/phosphosugar isomerase protein
MCGIVGVAGDLWTRHEVFMKRMFLLDWMRGPDSTGLAAIRSQDNEVKIAKVADHPLVLFDTGRFKEALSGTLSKVFIGHNRLATKGKINHGNTHPFEYGNIVGCHNGTLDWHSFDLLKRELKEEFDVDSQALLAAIDKWGLKKTINKIEGSWSLVYYDKSDDTLNFLRNEERPMYYAYSKDFKHLFWASEWPMIQAAVRLGGNADELFTDKEGNQFFKTEENTHYRFNVEE